jgi:coenzyme F420-reducing hydrogenase beta subunit
MIKKSNFEGDKTLQENYAVKELFSKVVENGYCIGCGACSFHDSNIQMVKNEFGFIQPIANGDLDQLEYSNNLLEICPFYNSELNESVIGEKLYGDEPLINIHFSTGYYLSAYAGHVKDESIRLGSSSGGLGSWIANKMIETDLVDRIIHVKASDSDDFLFSYQISDINNLFEGSKSRYYPIEMSKVLEFVVENDSRYLFVGLPCFVKAVRLLQDKHPLLKERIKFTLGLVCGHLKSDFFAKAIAWENGVKPSNINSIDFRTKKFNSTASRYSYTVESKCNATPVTIDARDSFVSNWGQGQFKYKACDYCDDVFAETADVVIGDAWLQNYNTDWKGNNIVLIRNNLINQMFLSSYKDLNLNQLDISEAITSQRGGLEHRRTGLSYRLFKANSESRWHPQKRVSASQEISNRRKLIYETRIRIQHLSSLNFRDALVKDNFEHYKNTMVPIISYYNGFYTSRTRRFFKGILLRLLGIKRLRKIEEYFNK